MARPHAIRWTSILATLALGALGGTALADPHDGDWNRGRDDHRSEHRWGQEQRRDRWEHDRGDAGSARGERYGRDDRWGHDQRYGRERPRWHGEDTPRYGQYGYYGYPYGYGYRGYDDGYRGHGDGYYGYRRYRHDDGRDDDAALTIAGGVIGGLIGNHAASPENRAAGTVFGAIIGGVLGHAIGQSNNDDHPHRRWRGERDDWD